MTTIDPQARRQPSDGPCDRPPAPIGRSAIRRRVGRPAAGFTLIELILVIIIILLLAAIAIPAFGALTYSSNQSGSANAVQAALQSAREVAVGNGSGRDAAAVFLLGSDGRVRIVVAAQAGTILDDTGRQIVQRDVFVPSPQVETFVLPRHWAVRGYAKPSALRVGSGPLADNEGWYEDTYTGADRDRGQWVFPETAFYDASAGDNGRQRQSFMVRFEGGTGRFLTSATSKALFLDPAPALAFRQTTPPWSLYRVDRELDPQRFVRKVLDDPTLSPASKRLLLGDVSSDTVLVGPVGQIAVYNERRMAEAIGADGLNRATDTLYRPLGGSVSGPQYDTTLFGSLTPAQINQAIDLWIRSAPVDRVPGVQYADTSDARIFLVSRYLGQPVEAAVSEVGP